MLLQYVQSKTEQQKILNGCHVDATAGHKGKTRTLYKVKERFMWHGMVKDVQVSMLCIQHYIYTCLLYTSDAADE